VIDVGRITEARCDLYLCTAFASDLKIRLSIFLVLSTPRAHARKVIAIPGSEETAKLGSYTKREEEAGRTQTGKAAREALEDRSIRRLAALSMTKHTSKRPRFLLEHHFHSTVRPLHLPLEPSIWLLALTFGSLLDLPDDRFQCIVRLSQASPSADEGSHPGGRQETSAEDRPRPPGSVQPETLGFG
jgi:hypothetical protein